MSIPRAAQVTVSFIEQYCAYYQAIFPDVRSFECFKSLHLGILSEIPRKTLPAIAKAVGLDNEQSLHHFLTDSPWESSVFREKRLQLIATLLGDKPLVLCIDETGDRKKGKTTDYVARQYIGNLGKVDNGIVSVNAYGVVDGITVPLNFRVFKPRKRLQEGDHYQSKPQLAIELIQELQHRGFSITVVLADSLYGESSEFINALSKLNLNYVVAIRANHGVLMPAGQRVRYTRWQLFDRVFDNGESEVRYIREIIFGYRRVPRYYQITTDHQELPPESTWLIMTNLAGNIQQQVGNTYGLRTWIEYGFKQSKNELGWADFRLTDYSAIEKWWEMVSSVYLMVSLQAPLFKAQVPTPIQRTKPLITPSQTEDQDAFRRHPWWDPGTGWKNLLNNLRLIIQPYVYYCLLHPWLHVFPLPSLTDGFLHLQDKMNGFQGFIPV